MRRLAGALLVLALLTGCGRRPAPPPRAVRATVGELLRRPALRGVQLDGVDPGEPVVLVGQSDELLGAVAAAVGAEVRSSGGQPVLWRAPAPRVRWVADEQQAGPARVLRPFVPLATACQPRDCPFPLPQLGQRATWRLDQLSPEQTEWVRARLRTWDDERARSHDYPKVTEWRQTVESPGLAGVTQVSLTGGLTVLRGPQGEPVRAWGRAVLVP